MLTDRYSTVEMSHIWSPAQRFTTWRTVAALMTSIKENNPTLAGQILSIDAPIRLVEVQAEEDKVGHDVVAFLNVWTRQLPDQLATKIHRGLTSSDLVDTSLAVTTSLAIDMIQTDLAALIRLLVRKVEEFWDVRRVGRTHGQVAEETTLGYQLAKYAQSLMDCYARLNNSQQTDLVIKMSGAVGCYRWSSVEQEVELAAALGPEFTAAMISGQCVDRQHYARIVSELAILASTFENLAMQVRLGQTLGELNEGHSTTRIGSSVMPHKRNPIRSEQVSGLARMVRAQVGPALESIPMWGEHDISHSSVERLVLPTAFHLTHYLSQSLYELFHQLQVDVDEIKNNVDAHQFETRSSAALVAMVDYGMPPDLAREAVRDLKVDPNSNPDEWQVFGRKLEPVPPKLNHVLTLLFDLMKELDIVG